MLQLLKDIVDRIQWPKVRREIQRLFPKTTDLAERMESDLMVAVNQIANGAIGFDIHYIDPKNGKTVVSLNELKMHMEQCARNSLGMAYSSKKFRKIFNNFSKFSLQNWMAKLEMLSAEILLERQTDACVPYPFITRSPSFFIAGNTMTDPWFLSVPGRKIPRMVVA